MTTNDKHMDTTGSEANKPENQNASDASQNPQENPQDVLNQRLAEIESRDKAISKTDSPTPKEEQQEMQPGLMTDTEAAKSEAITEVFAKANTDVADEDKVTGETPAYEKTESAGIDETAELPIAAPLSNKATDHEEEELEEEEDQVDYSSFSLEELRSHLNSILKSADSRKRHKALNELQRHYESKFQSERAEALEKFIQEGGTAEDFDYHTSNEHQELEKLLAAYRDARYQERQQTEQLRQNNLQRKRELLAQLRHLVESAETKNSSDEVKKLQAEWKTTGPVPAGDAQELWDSYHALLDIFYNNRSLFFEMKELDRKRNLDAKLHLISRAEALENESSVNKALQELRHLHEEWKSIGPVPNEQRDAIWDRFIQASEKVHTRRRANMEERKGVEIINLQKKKALLERLQSFQNFSTDRINDWRDKTDEIQKLKEEWDATGLVPKEYAEDINKNFWSNYKAFFQHKNQFFKGLDEQKMQNLQLKTTLCEEAESMKDSTDWNATKEKLIQLQKKWKTIGRVPDKHSDKIWNRFRSACNEFFDRKQTQEQQQGAEVERLSADKLALCDRVAEKLSQPNANTSIQEYEQFVQEWRSLDKNKKASIKLEEKFLVLIERYLERVPKLTPEERAATLVKLQVERLKGSPDASQKLHQREQALKREITHLQNDIQTLRTNIEFFARSKNADKLRDEYEGRIAEAQNRIEQLNRQLQAYRG